MSNDTKTEKGDVYSSAKSVDGPVPGGGSRPGPYLIGGKIKATRVYGNEES